MDRLAGKVALVTGAARGMGEAHARLFVAEGAKVVLTDVLAEAGRAVAADLGDAALFVEHDVSSRAGWAAAVAAAVARFGPVDVLVNNAGILGPLTTTLDLTDADYDRIIAVNQTGVMYGMQAVLPGMMHLGHGSIVNISSIAGLYAPRGVPNLAYAASKFAVRGMSKVVAGEFGKHGIRVNSVHPGFIDTDMAAPGAATADKRAEMTMLRRIGAVREVAQLVLFLASDEASYVTGGEHAVDAGLSAE